ncbi:hypothetical protein JHK86_047147 [Glycine max]|nr:hypothetical protein JHK86_047147 [Glycine max]
MAKRSVAANSSFESTSLASLDQKLAMAKRCSHEGAMAGAKAAVAATIATAIPTSSDYNILSSVAGAAYFIVADKTVLATARKNSFNRPSKA